MKLASLISSLTPSAQDVRDLDDLLGTLEAAPRRLQVLRQVLSNPDNTRQLNELLGALAADPPKRIPPVRAFLALAAAESEPAVTESAKTSPQASAPESAKTSPQAPESAPESAKTQAPENSKPQTPWRAPESSSAPAAPATPESALQGCGGTGLKGQIPCPLCGGRPDTNPACRPG